MQVQKGACFFIFKAQPTRIILIEFNLDNMKKLRSVSHYFAQLCITVRNTLDKHML